VSDGGHDEVSSRHEIRVEYQPCVFLTFQFVLSSIAVGTKDNGQYCIANAGELGSTVDDFCSNRRDDAYLRVYALLLGEFNLESYRATRGLTALFVIFTVVGVVILLNVLIAVIGDSYERAKTRSAKLFGRARVTFVAQNEALEVFLRPGSSPLQVGNVATPSRKAFIVGTHVFRWIVLGTLILTAMSAEIFLAGRAVQSAKAGGDSDLFYVALSILLTVLLSVALWIVVVFVFEPIVQRCAPRIVVCTFGLCRRCSLSIVALVASRLFGVGQGANVAVLGDGDDMQAAWNGRMDQIEQMVERALVHTRGSICHEIQCLEKRFADGTTTSTQYKNASSDQGF
jgi:hypothetical protein